MPNGNINAAKHIPVAAHGRLAGEFLRLLRLAWHRFRTDSGKYFK